MKCWIKIAATVLLIGLLGADIGLQTERYFGMPPIAAIETVADASKWTDRAQAFSAIAVAIFTVALFFASVVQGLIMGKQSRYAADQLAAFQAGERPYIFILSISEIDFKLDEGGDPIQRITYSVANHGHTPAVIEYMQIGHSINCNQPDVPTLAGNHHPLLISRVIASGQRCEQIAYYINLGVDWRDHYDPDNPSDELQQYPDTYTPILTEDESLYIRIIVGYHGVSSKGHCTSSCWRYNPETRQFIQYGGDDFNFVR
jgi:hypothetical protein